VNGHGGNSAPNAAVTTQVGEHDIFPITFNWWQAAAPEMLALSEADEGRVGHGGEWETSLQLHLRPHLIDSSKMTDDVFPNPFSAELRQFAQYAERRRDTAKIDRNHGQPAGGERGEGPAGLRSGGAPPYPAGDRDARTTGAPLPGVWQPLPIGERVRRYSYFLSQTA